MIRTLTPSDSPEVNLLVSKAFGYIPPHSFFDDFPVWDLRLAPPTNKQIYSFGISENGKLISHAAARIAEIQTASGLVPVGLIGAVATDAAYRAKGHSSTLMKHVLRFLEIHKCSWQLLWGSEHRFYAKLGFALAGQQFRAPISSLMQTHSQDLTEYSKIKTGIDESIFKALKAKVTGIKLNEHDRKWVYSQKTVHWYFLDNPFAFMGYGRGMDMGHIVHEFGGDKNSLLTLLSNLYLKDNMAQIMGTKSELQALGFTDSDLIQESLCLARSTPNTQASWKPDFWISGLGAC